jgi:hypothetical protein
MQLFVTTRVINTLDSRTTLLEVPFSTRGPASESNLRNTTSVMSGKKSILDLQSGEMFHVEHFVSTLVYVQFACFQSCQARLAGGPFKPSFGLSGDIGIALRLRDQQLHMRGA